MGYGGKHLERDRHITRQYFSNTLRINLGALLSKVDGKYPWQSDTFLESYPELANFLNNPDQDYGQTEEDYLRLFSQFREFSVLSPWMLDTYHDSLEKNLVKHATKKRRKIKSYWPHLVSFFIGILIGATIFNGS